MRSCERPRKRSASEALPSSVSKRYSFSTGTHGSACRRRASSSLRRVSSFSASSSSSRAARHSSRVPVVWVAMGRSLQSAIPGPTLSVAPGSGRACPCVARRLLVKAVVRGTRPASLDVSIDVLAMTDPDDVDDQLVVVDRIQDPVPALANPIAFVAGQLLRARGTRVVGQRLDAPDDPATVRLGGYPLEFLDSGLLDPQAIACHAA